MHPKHVSPKNLLKLFPNPQKWFTSVQKSLSFEFQVIWLTNMGVRVIPTPMAIRPPGPIFLKNLAQTVSKPTEVVHECAEKLKFRISNHLVNKPRSFAPPAIRPPGPIFLKNLAQTVSKPPEAFHECAEKLKFRISSHLVNKQVFAVAVTQARNFSVTGTITFRHI